MVHKSPALQAMSPCSDRVRPSPRRTKAICEPACARVRSGSPAASTRKFASKAGEVAATSVASRCDKSSGTTRLAPGACSDAGNTAYGISGTLGSAAEVYSW
jgi:hypothetical protein